MLIVRECKICSDKEPMPMSISWTDEALNDGSAAEYYNNYICNECFLKGGL